FVDPDTPPMSLIPPAAVHRQARAVPATESPFPATTDPSSLIPPGREYVPPASCPRSTMLCAGATIGATTTITATRTECRSTAGNDVLIAFIPMPPPASIIIASTRRASMQNRRTPKAFCPSEADSFSEEFFSEFDPQWIIHVEHEDGRSADRCQSNE